MMNIDNNLTEIHDHSTCEIAREAALDCRPAGGGAAQADAAPAAAAGVTGQPPAPPYSPASSVADPLNYIQ